MRYFIIAGEVSGDQYARQLMHALAEADSLAEFKYRGPDTKSAVMGFVEIAARLGSHLRELSRCKKDLLEYNPDALILIDYPGFNLPMAKFASRKGIKTLYYIAPKVWASRERRVRSIRKHVTQLYVIFPFEVDYFESKGINAVYLGNPALDNLSVAMEELDPPDVFSKKYKIGAEPVLAILPGSRLNEIKFLLPRAAQVINRFKGYQWVVAATPSIPITVYDEILKDLPVRVMYGHTYEIMQQAEAALVTSGTATLEAALLNCPQVVCYGGNSLSMAIARLIIKVKHISLPNLILEKASVRELIQKDCNPLRMEEELRLLLKGRQRRRSILADYKRLQRILGMDGATERIARHMYTLLTGGPQVPRYKVYCSTPLGNFSFSANEFEELTACGFEDNYNLKGFYKSRELMDPGESKPPVLLMAIEQLDEYFKGTRRSFDLPLRIEGTDFQKNVWANLLKIPYGTTISYAELAQMAGNPKATRAVGQANYANPFAIIIPCHRVIGADGSLVGYAAGLGRKQKLLAMEKSYAPESSNALF
ncbi:MAG: lipid-A-disaccharide synthase [Bacteroidales bacterium]|jgi:lipid-A-disaccharide synthase|nr:lipid-A-disaccharide synthase [Bacteroidales bacterium]MDD2264470.1 lipid-A-disaccharide synthase [Bacteroidales bacterium]MDD2831705.1 lipid-A-disaccharide synthase [Bacteroidales bacterium]MDD3208932.1 lipid-A-disaccharide synthase [Bacteroidales bacterium]MDD3697696.1 lipid-A-disaccharide synthase [Bacteroidales bacterium]